MGHRLGLFQSKNFKDFARKMTIYAGKMSFHAAAIDYLRQSSYHDNGGSIILRRENHIASRKGGMIRKHRHFSHLRRKTDHLRTAKSET